MMSGHVIYFKARRELSPQSVLHQRIVLSAGEEGFNKKSAKWRGQGSGGGGGGGVWKKRQVPDWY